MQHSEERILSTCSGSLGGSAGTMPGIEAPDLRRRGLEAGSTKMGDRSRGRPSWREIGGPA